MCNLFFCISFSVNILQALINKMHISIQGPLSLDANTYLHLWFNKKQNRTKNHFFFTKPKLSKTEKNRTLYPVILGIAYQIER